MADSEKIRRIEDEIKDLDLDFMRGLISKREYSKKAKSLIDQLIEAGGVPQGFASEFASSKPIGKSSVRRAALEAPGKLRKKARSILRQNEEVQQRIIAEIEQLDEEIGKLELDYEQGLIPVGIFATTMTDLKTKRIHRAQHLARFSSSTTKAKPMITKDDRRLNRWRKYSTSLTSAAKRQIHEFAKRPQVRFIMNYSGLLLVVILAVVLRIPRVPHLQGYDGFVLISEAYSLLDGYAATWLITPASYFGMFTFSGYPIGSIAMLALFIAVSGSLEIASFYFITFFTILMVAFSYLLMKEFFDDERIRLAAVLFYVMAPVTYEYTYNSPTARAPFLALLPLCILSFVKLCRDGGMKNLLQTVIIIVIMMLFHRMAIVLFFFLPVVLFYKLLRRIVRGEWTGGEARLLNKFMILVFLLGLTAIFPISLILFGASPKHLLPEGYFPSWSLPYLQDLANLSLDYLLFYGAVMILALYGVISLMRMVWTSQDLVFDKQQKWASMLLLLLPLMIFVSNPAYTRNLLSPFVACFAGYGTMKLLETKKVSFFMISFLAVAPFIAYLQLYNVMWENIEPYASIATLIMSLSLIGMLISGPVANLLGRRGYISNPLNKRNTTRIILIIIVLLSFTIATTDMQRDVVMYDTSIPIYVTDEEVTIAAYIKTQHALYPDKSILLCSHEMIEHRIAAYAESTCLSDGSGTALMEVGFITRADAIANSSLNLFGDFFEQHWYEHIDPDRTLPQRHWFWIMQNNYSNPAVQERLRILHIRYFVGLKGTNESLYSFFGPFVSLFRETITAPIVLETQHYLVYKLD